MHMIFKLVTLNFRNHCRSNNISVRYLTTFKDRAINFLYETRNNAFTEKTQVNGPKSALTDSEEMKKRERFNTFADIINKQPLCVLTTKIKEIDAEYCNFFDIMSYNEILKLSLFLTKINSTLVTQTNFYNKAKKVISQGLSNKVFNNSEIVVCLYLFGLKKKKALNDINKSLTYLEFDKLSLYETCIVAETTFKCGIKLSRIQVKYIETLIENEAKVLVSDLHLLVPLCKVLRLACPSTSFSPNNLNREIVKKEGLYTMVAAIHILKLYAEIHLAEHIVLQRLITDIMENISLANKKHDYHKNKIYQPKYLDGFLWSICMLNYTLIDEQLFEIRTFMDNMKYNLFNNPQKLLRILLSLWILGYRAECIIQECIEKEIFWNVRNEKFWKLRTSLNLLLCVIQIESPNIQFPTNMFCHVYVSLQISKSVQFIATVISELSEKMKLQNVVINSPVEQIYIAGVSFEDKTSRSFHIDVLSDNTCLRFQRIPHGLLNLKLRLIQQLGYQSILINEDDVEDRIAGIAYIEKCLQEIVYTKK